MKSPNSSLLEIERAKGLIPVAIEKQCWDHVSLLLTFEGRASGVDKFVTVLAVEAKADVAGVLADFPLKNG